MFDRIPIATLPNNSPHLHQTLAAFPGMFGNIPGMFEVANSDLDIGWYEMNYIPINVIS